MRNSLKCDSKPNLGPAGIGAVWIPIGGVAGSHAWYRPQHAQRGGISDGIETGAVLVIQRVEGLEHQYALDAIGECQHLSHACIHHVLSAGAQTPDILKRNAVPAAGAIERV